MITKNISLLEGLAADFNEAIKRVFKQEGGYQNSAKDAGNFYNGVNYGTKLGVTPAAYISYYKTPLQPDTIKNLTTDKAAPIYRQNYWDKIRGTDIANDSIANLLTFLVVNSGTGQLMTIKKVMNTTAGKKIVAETFTPLTKQEVELLNNLDQELFFNNIKAVRRKFYNDLAKNKPSQAVFLTGWLRRLEEHKFSGKTSNKRVFLYVLGGLALAGGAYYVYNNYSNRQAGPKS
jgi:lysozyme family protein